MPKAFISYQRSDGRSAEALAASLTSNGIEAWWDREILPGEEWRERIVRAIRDADYFIVLFSRAAEHSLEVRKEVGAAAALAKPIIAVRLEKHNPEGALLYELAGRSWLDAFDDPTGVFEALARNLADGRPLAQLEASSAANSPSPAIGADGCSRRVVAVLPFANLTGRSENDFLGEGIAEELISALSKTAGLRVPARTSSFAYRGQNADIRRIARDLSADFVVEGAVRLGAERIRVTAQLVDAISGFPVWSDKFDRSSADLFEIQDEIADAIAGALKIHLGGVQRGTTDLAAYQSYIQANALAARARPEDLRDAVRLYDEAVQIDPSFADAWGRRGAVLLRASNNGVLPLSARAEARASAEKARILNPELAAPYMVVAGLDGLTGRWLEAEAGFREAIRRDPAEATGYNMLAYYVLGPCGHIGKARAAAAEAFALAPAAPLHSLSQATFAALAGDEEEVLRQVDKAVLLGHSPDEPAIRAIRAEAALREGDWPQAVEHVGASLPSGFEAIGKAVAEQVYKACLGLGSCEQASSVVQQLSSALNSPDQIARFQIAIGTMMSWQSKLGNIDAAYAIGEQIIAAWKASSHLATMALFQLWLPEMVSFRRDPRFQQLVEELGMIPYWEAHGPPDGYMLDGGRLIGVA